MICSILSIFDPSPIGITLSTNWVSSLISIFLLGSPLVQRFYVLELGGVILWFTSIVCKIFGNNELLLLSLTFLLLLLGVSGMIPWSFAISSHIVITLSLSIPLWFSGVIYTYIRNNEEIVAHLLPLGSPTLLFPFLILVESVSLLIRPLTLGIRLMANVISGHIIISLVGSVVYYYSIVSLFPGVVLESIFFTFEVGISLIQSYVFVTLISLYWDE